MFFLLLFVCTMASISKLRPEGKKDNNACFFLDNTLVVLFLSILRMLRDGSLMSCILKEPLPERERYYLPTYYILYYLDSIEEDEAAGLDRKAATSDDLLVTTQ